MEDTHEDLEARLDSIELRLDQIDLALTHLSGRSYAPNDPRVRAAVSAIRERAGTLAARARPPWPERAPPGAAKPKHETNDRARELAEAVMTAAAEAREARGLLDELRAQKADAGELSKAEAAAEAAEKKAHTLAEAAKAELTPKASET